MSKLKAIILFIVSAFLTWVLYKLISSEAGHIGSAQIDNIGDLLSYIVSWLGYLCSIFNIILYVALFFAWKAFFKEVEQFMPDSDTKTGVDDNDYGREGDSLWDYKNDMYDSWD